MPKHDVKSVLHADSPETRADFDSWIDRLERSIGAALNLPPWREQPADWNALLGETLSAWQGNPDLLADEDEGIEPPSLETLSVARDVARALVERGLPSPERIVPDGDGGLTIKWRRDTVLAALEICDEGMVELVVYKDGHVDSTERIPLPAAD